MYRHDEEDIKAGVDSFLDMAGEGRTDVPGTAGVAGAAEGADPASAFEHGCDVRTRGQSYVQHCLVF
ncbi:hypothetical protein C454_00675 [Haloferax gibbonsii ATCC 33959]|uniref:Uncharacterized protein n=1 Tax=Haloferax gibbonsii (strain ATCC 33959 / DSM 4427 / JCM 8863 / NBRC 102184 / NCIMB 2188 / Ma 2.38) TaxID=1227459 RepID=M0HNQ4_HALGM|nr:hypothetical protein C454_00675 [Haloferax gibbonsii ATCC 33959]